MGKAKRTGPRRQIHKAPAGTFGGPAKTNPNPFEVKVNRQKFQILGRKTRHDVGLPGVSRARAIRKVRGQALPGSAYSAPWLAKAISPPLRKLKAEAQTRQELMQKSWQGAAY